MSKYAGYFKGKLLNEYPDVYTVVDIETTGLDPISCKIIEISAVKYRCNRKVDEYVTFISIDEKVPDRITKLTGITNDMLKGAPKAAEALSGFLNLPRLKSRGSQPRILTDSDSLGYPRNSYGSYKCYTPTRSPSFRMLIAAFASLSCTEPHPGHIHSLTDKSFVSVFLYPQQLQS